MWRLTHQVHFPTLALGALWIVHSLATTMYVPWQNQRQRAALEQRLADIEAAQRIQEQLIRRASNSLADLATARDAHEDGQLIAEITLLYERTTDAASQEALTHLRQELPSPPSTSDSELLAELPRQMEYCRALIGRQEQLLLDVVDQRSRTDVVVMGVRAVLLVLGLMVGVGLAMWMARGLQRSLAQISVTLRGAEGELTTDVGQIQLVPGDAHGELTSLESQVQNVVRNIQRVAGELQQARRDMVRAERLAAVGEVAAGVAHEIRNPLTSVKLVVQRAAERRPVHSLNEEQLQILLEEVSRIENTVQGLLDFARPETPQRVRCQLAPIVKRTLTLLEGRLRQQRVDCTCSDGASTAFVNVDPHLIQQVLVNLFINSLEALSNGGKIEVRETIDPGGDEVVLEIEDNGPGISPDVMDRLFEPFVTTRAKGSGLGLAISRRLIEDHGGRLDAANVPTGGAVFSVRLPCEHAASLASLPRVPFAGEG